MKQNVGKAVKIAVLTVGAFVMIFPFLWMLFTSLKTLPESISIPPTLFPAVPQFENYTEALAVAPFGLYLRNSIIVAGGGTLLTLVLTVLSAYGFTIYEFRGKKLLFLLCLSTMMIPAELLIIQNFITISKLGWMDTFQGIILPTVASGFYIYMMREYFMQIPLHPLQSGQGGRLQRLALPLESHDPHEQECHCYHWNSGLYQPMEFLCLAPYGHQERCPPGYAHRSAPLPGCGELPGESADGRRYDRHCTHADFLPGLPKADHRRRGAGRHQGLRSCPACRALNNTMKAYGTKEKKEEFSMKRKLISVSLALALGLSLAACGSKPAPSGAETPAGELGTLSGPVELQFWHSISNQNHLKVLEGLVEEFNETIGAEKGITVVPTFNGSSSELYSSVVGAIKAGSAPDVTLALRPYVADYLQTDYVVNLEPYITDPNVGMTDYEDIFEGLREANSSYAKEGIYSLPIHSYSEVLYYNKTFFAEHGLSVPTTWDELVETCRAIRDITGAPAFGWDNLAGSFMTLLLQNGGRYTDQNGNLYFATEDSDITLKVLQMWQDNVNEGIWRTAGEDQFFSGPFANEMIPMYIGDSVEASYIPDKNPELDWGTAPVPQVSEDTAANLSAGHVIIALNQDGNQDRMYAAYEFIKFMTSHDANLAVAAGNTGYLPIRQSVAEDPAYEAYVADGHEYMRAGVEQSDRYFYEPVFTNATTTSSAVNSAVKTMMQEVADNGMEPEQALANLKQTVGAN